MWTCPNWRGTTERHCARVRVSRGGGKSCQVKKKENQIKRFQKGGGGERQRAVPGVDRREEAVLRGGEKEKEEGSVSENPSAFLQHSSRVAPCTEGHTSSLETQPPHAHNNTMAELHSQTHNTLAGVPAQWQSSLLAAKGRKSGREDGVGRGGGGQNEHVAKNITVSATIFRNAVHLFGFCQKQRKK